MKASSGIVRIEKGESRLNQGVGWVRERITTVREFYEETRLEMKRVTWPTRKQVQATTIVVIVTVFFFGAYFYLTDKIIDQLVRMVFKLGRG